MKSGELLSFFAFSVGGWVTRHRTSVATVCERQDAELHVEDLRDLLFRDNETQGRLRMIFHCFLDDSKDQDESKVFVSAGFIASQDNWTELRLAWKRCLRENGIQYFKTSEYKMLRGEFGRFRSEHYPAPRGREKAAEIRDALLAIPRGLRDGIKGVGCAIPIEDYERVCARPEAREFFGAPPYRRALEGIFNEVGRLIKGLPGHHAVAYVHDDGPDFDLLQHYYEDYRDINKRHARLMGGFIPMDDKENPALQMADALANFAQEMAIEWLQNGRKPFASAFPFEVYHIGIWDERYMLGLIRHELNRRGKPVPADLEKAINDLG